ncbi:MAG: hypothetical protein ABIE23_02340 [archaeon]
MKAENNCFHNYQRIYDNLMNRFERDETVSSFNKRLLLSYREGMFSEGISLPRIIRVFYSTYQLTKWLNKDWSKVTKNDLIKLTAWIQRSDYAEKSKCEYKIIIKRFYKWWKGNGEKYPPIVEWIKTTLKVKYFKLPEELLTEEEVKKIIEESLKN